MIWPGQWWMLPSTGHRQNFVPEADTAIDGDVLDLTGVSPGYTHSALKPVKRIDYIWISSDLAASEVVVGTDPASDHLPVVATFDAAAVIHSPQGPMFHVLD